MESITITIIIDKKLGNDCQKRCVYCDIHEFECGGEEVMEIEHFRPEKHFASLSSDPHNLVYSCCGCNNLKSDNWPALGCPPEITMTGNGEGYLDPFSRQK